MSVTPHMVDRLSQQVARLGDARSPAAGIGQAMNILNAIGKAQPARSDPEAVKQLAALIKPALKELDQFLHDHLRDIGQTVEQRREKQQTRTTERPDGTFFATFSGGTVTIARTGETHPIDGRVRREVRLTSNGRYVAKNGDVFHARQHQVSMGKRRGGE